MTLIDNMPMLQEVDQDTLSSHEGGLAAPYVPIEEVEAIALVRQHYGLVGTVQRFATEKDDTFLFEAQDGQQFVLKVANPSETELEIDFQIALMNHVARVAPTLPVPRVLQSLQQRQLFQVRTGGGDERYLRLMTFLPGMPLARTSCTAAEREHIGELLARLRLATADFSHPADNRVLAWDAKHLLSLKHLLAHVHDSRQRAALEEGLKRFEAIAPRLAACRTQVLHNDFNTSNIVVDHDRPEFVTGIIDFGDSVRTAVAIDVATALMNQLPRDTPADRSVDIFGAARDVLRGYLRHAELTQEELALIPHLAMARVITRALITTWRAQLFPENQDYILRNTVPGWDHLDWFLRRTPQQVSGLLLPSPI